MTAVGIGEVPGAVTLLGPIGRGGHLATGQCRGGGEERVDVVTGGSGVGEDDSGEAVAVVAGPLAIKGRTRPAA
ncbi:hypothetical protein KBZ00_14390 [Streptomyces sp. RK31]|uniref:hypothetical protein n=1 Tax=Streptomyces sp. RK31 TaxID=2824892 RepID=UPI001B358204|nr:hypothetical protein [Streptomyces sp. RK31]MBQ0972321.1 hypothetical protein [Streptomyces sp. RK31]